MNPKQTRTLFLVFFAGLIPLYVSGAFILGDKTDERPACASFFAGQTFEGGPFSLAYRVKTIRADDQEIEVYYPGLGQIGIIGCSS